MKQLYSLKSAIFLIAVFLNMQSANSQDFIKVLTTNLDAFHQVKTPEKVYVHIDKTLYTPGENVWFKTYTVNGISHKLNINSAFVYVELINPNGTVKMKKTLGVFDGVSSDFFQLDPNLKGGLYKIRAYTLWMKNFNDAPIFEKEIMVQKVMIPKLLLKLDFDKESYGPGQNVVANLEVKDLTNEPLKFHPVRAKILIDNQIIKEINLQTNVNGKVFIPFDLPNDLNTNDGILTINMVYDNQTEAITRSVPIVLNNIDLNFFPEGGYVVAGTQNKIAFEALNEFGLPADVEGVILDENNNIIQSFNSYHQGMGAFIFVPEYNKTYKAKILKPKELDTLYNLPQSFAGGFVLSYKNTSHSNLNFNIYSSLPQSVFMVASIRDSIRHIERVDFDKGNNNYTIPTDKLTDGIVRVTLFNSMGVPECERLVYFGKVSPMEVDIKVSKNKFSFNQLANVDITTTYNGKPVSASLSMSVVDDKNLTFIDDKQDNILSWLLLSSEIKGKIHEPIFYFDQQEKKDSVTLALDYLLMTHGWRGFKWKEILNTKPAVQIAAEENATFAGRVYDYTKEKGVSAKVWLFELGNLYRASSLQTTNDGYFIFNNIDPNVNFQIIAKTKRRTNRDIRIIQMDITDPEFENIVQSLNNNTETDFIPWDNNFRDNNNNNLQTIIAQNDTNNIPATNKAHDNNTNDQQTVAVNDNPSANVPNDVDFQMDDDGNVAVSEVVVTALGVKRDQKSVGYSVTSVNSDDLARSTNAINALQGKVAGVNITSASGSAGSSNRVVFRGMSSYVPDNNPLLVIDGVPVETDVSIENTIASYVNPDDISSIDFYKGNTATAVYGSRALNGAIIITTNNQMQNYANSINRNNTITFMNQPFLSQSNNSAYKIYYNTKEYWQQINNNNVRNATVFWNSEIETDANGNASIQIFAPDEVSSYRILTEGISTNGNIGCGTAVLNVVKPINMITKVPYELTYNDTLNIPVIVKNSTSDKIEGVLEINHTTNFKLLSNQKENIVVDGDTSVKYNFTFVTSSLPGTGKIKINFNHQLYPEEYTYDIKVNPKGFPITTSFSSNAQEETYTFNLDEPLEGSLHGQFNLYVNVMDDMIKGLEGMLRQPYGCFEQTSSSTYPNILVLDILQQSGNSDQQLQQRALNFIDAGYKRLVGYETALNGFEWFGNTPPHEGLTAMGILEFTDMKKVYGGVDEQMLQRTKDWLMSRRDGFGNFTFSTKYLHSWYNNQDVANAYIIFALSKSGITEIEKEYEVAKNEALSSKDAYRLGLLANAAYYLNKKDDLDELILAITTQLANNTTFNDLEIAPSITSSTGTSLKIETASLYLMALLKQDIKNNFEIEQTMSFLYSNRTSGYFGSTQGTVLALSALAEYYKLFTGNVDQNIELLININGNEILKTVNKADKTTFTIENLEQYLTNDGEQTITVKFLSDQTIPYSIDFGWHSTQIYPDNSCKIALQTGIQNQNVKVGDNVRMDVFVENTSDKPVPMTVAEIGIPSGLSIQPWQLQEFSKKQLWDYYEIFDGKLVVYYTSLDANEKRHIKLDLKADLAGSYTAKASSAYLYYTNEHKDWNKGTHVNVTDI